MSEKWHASFRPKDFLTRVNLEKLLYRNKAFNAYCVKNVNLCCVFCDKKSDSGLILNNRSFLCNSCYNEISLITYPEAYENKLREYLTYKATRPLAWENLRKEHEYKKDAPFLGCLVFFSFFLLNIDFYFILVPVSLSIISAHLKKKHDLAIMKWDMIKAKWESSHPIPVKPVLKHFHSPDISLTEKDKRVLYVFNHWPGYPPFWRYLRAVVLNRDGNRCQVTGCPSRVNLHVHHIIAVSEGGEHTPENLVTLCDYHHALEPVTGHEKIWEEIKTRYFTIVCKHKRRNRLDSNLHGVKKHIRRIELITLEDVDCIIDFHNLSCPNCKKKITGFSIFETTLRVWCTYCSECWDFKRELAEETGPYLAEIFPPKRNIGSWHTKWYMHDKRITKQNVSDYPSRRKKTSTIKKIKQEKTVFCPICNSTMILKKPKADQDWDAFWGCSKYFVTGCKGYRKYNINLE